MIATMMWGDTGGRSSNKMGIAISLIAGAETTTDSMRPQGRDEAEGGDRGIILICITES